MHLGCGGAWVTMTFMFVITCKNNNSCTAGTANLQRCITADPKNLQALRNMNQTNYTGVRSEALKRHKRRPQWLWLWSFAERLLGPWKHNDGSIPTMAGCSHDAKMILFRNDNAQVRVRICETKQSNDVEPVHLDGEFPPRSFFLGQKLCC